MESNLLVTYNPAHPGLAEREIKSLLEADTFEFIDATMSGLFLISVESPKKVVSKLKKLPRDSFEDTYKWVPIEKWLKSDIREMSKVLRTYNEKIGKNESWKLLLFKRFYNGHETRKLIQMLTENIERERVDMTNPDKLIVVEIIGTKTGISLLTQNEYLDANKLD